MPQKRKKRLPQANRAVMSKHGRNNSLNVKRLPRHGSSQSNASLTKMSGAHRTAKKKVVDNETTSHFNRGKERKVLQEEYFPRGGSVKTTSKPELSTLVANPEADLFQEVEEEHKKLDKKMAKLDTNRRKEQIHKNKPDVVVSKPEPHLLTQQVITPGMLVLGFVKEVHEYNLTINLPNNLTGTVSIMHISDTYTEKLQGLAKSGGNETSSPEDVDVHDLQDLFKVGMMVSCKVISIYQTKNLKVQIKLNINPKDVNSELVSKSLRNGLSLFGSISSVEDRGYVVDLGVKGVHAFMKSNDAERFIQLHNDGFPLNVGQSVLCSVKTDIDRFERLAGETRTVNVTIDPTQLASTEINENMNLNFNCLQPGMRVTVTVTKVFDNGVVVKFQSFKGSIHITHLQNKTPEQNTELKATILYIHPTTKAIVLSELQHIVTYSGVPDTQHFKDYSRGDIIEKAHVSHADQKLGVYFKLDGHVLAHATRGNLSDEGIKNVKQTYKRGSCHRCLVVDVNWMENEICVGMRKSLFSQSFLSIKDLKPGDLFECEVKGMKDVGAVVQCGNITGLIPRVHLADVPLKKPEKKFVPGLKLKCRILRVDLEKKNILLTKKKSLVNSKLCLLSNFSQLETGLQTEGYIIKIFDMGVLVGFYGNMKGFVPKKYLSTEDIPHPDQVFYIGQVLKCRVLTWDEEKQRITLSLTSEEWKPHGSTLARVPDDYQIGKLVKCKITMKKLTGLNVEVQPSGVRAFIPRMHLSDFIEICDILMDRLKPGDLLSDCMYLNRTSILILTRRESMIVFGKDNTICTEMDQLQEGMLIPGSVKGVHPKFGVFIELPGRLVGLAVNRFVADRKWEMVKEELTVGQAVMAKIIQVDTEEKKCLLSMKLDDCYYGDTDIGLNLLEKYLKCLSCFTNEGEPNFASDIEIGCMYLAHFLEILDDKAVFELEGHKVIGTCPTEQLKGELERNEEIEVVVLNKDYKNKSLDLLVNQSVTDAVKNKQSNKIKVGQKVKGDVVLVKSDFVLVLLQEPLKGNFAYIPSRRHINDIMHQQSFTCGQSVKIIIKRVCDEGTLCVTEQQENEKLGSKNSSQIRQASTAGTKEIVAGALIQGKVQKLKKRLGILVNLVGGSKGIVSLTDISDEYQNNPLSEFRIGQSLNCYVIGEGSRHNFHLSLRKSRLNGEQQGIVDKEVEEVGDLEVGQVVRGYVVKKTETDLSIRIGRNNFATIEGADILHLDRRMKRLLYKSQVVISARVESTEKNKVVMSFVGIKDENSPRKPEKRKINTGSDSGNTKYKKARTTESDSSQNCDRTDRFVFQETGKSKYSSEKRKKDSEDTCSSQICDVKKLKTVSNQSDIANGRTKNKSNSGKAVQTLSDEMTKPKSKNKIASGDIPVNESKDVPETSSVFFLADKKLPRLQISEGFSWDTDLKTLTDQKHDDSSDSELEESQNNPKKTKNEKKAEEARLFEYERKQLEGDITPENSEDFDRLVLQSPNSSLVWIRYMAFHLELSEIEKAQVVAERALKIISFREEQERLNVWMAYLNLENMHGTPSQLHQVLERAVQQNEPLHVYQQMINIFVKSGKLEEAEQLYNKMVKKYSAHKTVWLGFGQFYFRNGRTESARKLLQRSLNSLEKPDHVDTIAKFAQMEFKFGDFERGKTMFENILKNYPKRTDLWSVYIDMVVKVGDLDAARLLFERVINIQLGVKKMKFFFKKYLDFEDKHGDESTIENVRQKAQEYVDSH